MFSAKLKTNARKSTHSGKVRRGTSSFQDRHWQDASSYSSCVSQDGRSREKPHFSSAGQPRDRTIWDTKFTEPEPAHSESSDDVIWVSTETSPNPKHFPKHNAKVSVFNPKAASGTDRNIFSALSPSKRASESRPSHATTHHGSRTSHQTSSASRSLSFPPGRNSSDFVFKKPTAPPPVSRNQQSVNGSPEKRQKPSLSGPSLSKTRHAKQLGNSRTASGSVPTSARAHAGGKTKRSQRSTSMSGLSQSDDIIPILERREIFTRRPSSGSGTSISNPQNLEWHGKIKMKINTKGLKKLKEMGKLKYVNTGLRKTDSLGIGTSTDSSLHGHGRRESIGNMRGLGDFGDLGNYGKFRGMGGLGGFGGFGGLGQRGGELGGLSDLGGSIDLEGFGNLRGPTDFGGLGKMHVGRNFRESSSMLNGVPRTRNSKGSSPSIMSSTKNKPQKPGKLESGFAATSNPGATSASPFKPVDKFSPRSAKSILTKSTSKRPGTRQPPQQVRRNRPNIIRSSVAPSRPVIDLCKPATSQKSVNTRVRTPTASPNCPTRTPSSHKPQASSPARKVIPMIKRSGQPQKKLVKNLQQKEAVHSLSESKERSSSTKSKATRSNKASVSDITTLTNAVVPLERLEVRLSPVRIQSGVPWDEDEIDGISFSSFSTQSELESYLRTHPGEMAAQVQHDTGSSHKPLPLQVRCPTSSKPPSLGGENASNQNQFEQLEQKLLADLQDNASHEILHPKLAQRGLSIKRDMIGNEIKCINLRTYGIRWTVRAWKGAHKSRRRARLTECKKSKSATKLKINSSMKCSAVPLTGLKIKFTVRGKEKNNETAAESKANPEPISDKAPEPLVTEAESATKSSSKKLPVAESIPFKPFEKEVMSSKSAFVSDALDKYLEDVKKESSVLAGPAHPLLQSKASSITFKMPSKQSSYFKTLDMALRERQMAKYKGKIPTVAETAQKLAKSLKHTSDAFRMSDSQSAPMETESSSSDVEAPQSDSTKIPDAVRDQPVTESPEYVQSTPLSFSPKTPRKETNLEEKKRLLEERLESVRKKLKESNAFLKKSPTKARSLTGWATKLKIVNSRLIQQLNAPGKNAHLIRSKEASQQAEVKIKVEKDAPKQNLSLGSQGKPSPEAQTGKPVGSGKGKKKAPKEFLRLDQQTTCDKEHCKLGCICESINLNLPVERLTKHCRKVECMFECVCQRGSVRILRNRKRPTIFKEKSMLFYDGVGMFSNNNAAFVEEETNPAQNREKPGILASLTSCARATIYKPKTKHQRKPTKLDNPSSTFTNSQKKEEQKKVSISEQSGVQQQSLPKQALSNCQPALKTPPLTTKQELPNLKKVQEPNISEAKKTGSSLPKAGEVVPSVLYAPVQVPLSNQQGMVLLYAPVNTLPYMVQKVPVCGNLEQIPSQAANGSKPTQTPGSNPSSGASVTASSDPKLGDKVTKPVAVISPSTSTNLSSCSKAPPVCTQVSDSKSSAETGNSCKVCEFLESGGEHNVSFKGTSPTSLRKEHTCTKASADKEKETEMQSTTSSSENGTNGLATDKSSAEKPEDSISAEQVKEPQGQIPAAIVQKDCSASASKVCADEDSTVCDSQTDETVSVDQTKKPHGDTQASLDPKGDPTSATKVCVGNGTSMDSEKSVPTSAVQLEEIFQGVMAEMSDAKEKISAFVTRINSPVKSPTTSPTAGSSTSPLNLVITKKPAKPQSDSVHVGRTVADLNKKLKLAALSQPKEVPGFSHTLEKKEADEKNPKLTKTQVFLPGSSMSAINSKNPASNVRSPLLIEIQSECNWEGTKNDILSTIAKHTSTANGGPGVMRVGKYLVEILSKEEQKNITVSVNKKTFKEPLPNQAPVSAKKVEHKQPSVTCTSNSLPACVPLTSTTPAVGKQVSQLVNQLPVLGKQVPTLGAQMPTQEKQMSPQGTQVPTPTTQVPTPAPQVSSKSNPSTESQKTLLLQNNSANKELSFAKAGTITAPLKPGTAPLLTTLPPGSILISDGKTPAGYLVPLKAVQETIKGTFPPAIQSMTLKQPTSQANQIPPNGLPDAPKIMPRLGPISMGTSKDVTTTTSSSKPLPVALGQLPNSLKIAAQSHPVLKAAPQSAVPTRIPTTLSSSTPLQHRHILPHVNAPVLGPATHNLPLRLSQGLDPSKPKVVNLLPGQTVMSIQGLLRDRQNVAADVLCSTDESEFVDVESLDGIHPRNLLKHKPPLLKPNPSQSPPVFPVALTSDAPASAKSRGSRRKSEHKVRAPFPADDTEEEIDVVSCVEPGKGNQRLLHCKTPVRSSSSSSRRKRKSPIVQQSAMALEEPEFIESYFEVSSGEDDNRDGEPKHHRRDKPNKVLHLIKERQRRRDQSDLFGGLKSVLVKDKHTRAPKVVLLEMALKEIQRLEAEVFEAEIEGTGLKRENFQKRSRLASLLDLNVHDFPSAFADHKDPDFSEYVRELEFGSDRATSAAQSETTSQDSESIDLDSSDDDADTGKGMTDLVSNLTPKSRPQVIIPDPTSCNLVTSARHASLPMTVVGVNNVSRVIAKSKPAASPQGSPTGVSFKGPVPVALHALPFNLHMTPPRTPPNTEVAIPEVTNSEVTDSEATDSEVEDSEVEDSEVEDSEVADSEVADSEVADSEVADSGVADSGVAVPGVAVPEVTVPKATVPEVAVPEVAVPEAAVPEAAVPEVARPEVAVPEIAVPEVAVPEVAVPEAVQNVDLLMEVSTESPPSALRGLSGGMEETTPNSPPGSQMETLPVPNTSETALTENDPQISNNVPDAVSTTIAEDITSQNNQNDGEKRTCDRVGIVDSLELETATKSIEQNNGDSNQCNKNSEPLDLSTALVGASNKTVDNEIIALNEASATLCTVDVCTQSLSDRQKETSQDNGKTKSGSGQDSPAGNSCVVENQESESDDEVLVIDLEAGSEGKDSVTTPSVDAPSGEKQAALQKEAHRSPKKRSPSTPADNQVSTQPATAIPDSANPSNLSVESINIKGGVVTVTCSNGEVIPLAVVKASADGTMQVAVEGDISSEKVEELLSKSEVMDCLEKVADNTCEMSDS